jgi:hypothetical protein
MCFPLAYGECLHTLIPDSKITVVLGMGHMFTASGSLAVAERIADSISGLCA